MLPIAELIFFKMVIAPPTSYDILTFSPTIFHFSHPKNSDPPWADAKLPGVAVQEIGATRKDLRAVRGPDG